jgi:predicted dehydrogenase
MGRIRWGVLGNASIAREGFIPAVLLSGNGVVHAIASRDLGTARELAGRFGIPRAYGSYDDLLDDPEVDAVYLPLPNSLHAPWALRCAQAGKPTLCEKPAALSAGQARQMVDAFAARGLTFSENFVYRFHPQTRKVRALLDEGAVGRIRSLCASRSYVANDPSKIALDRTLGGGALMDVGCYCVNALRYFAGAEPDQCHAVASWAETSGVDEALAGVLRFPGGVIGHFDCGMRTVYGNGYEIRGDRGRIVVDSGFDIPTSTSTTIHCWRDDACEVIEIAPTNQFQHLVEDFAAALQERRPPLLPAEEAVCNMKVIDALYASARQAGQDIQGTFSVAAGFGAG